MVLLQVLKGNPGDPFSVLTKLGWTLNSIVPSSYPDCVSLAVVSNFVYTSIDAKLEAVKDTALDHVGSALKFLSISTDHKVLDIYHRESIVFDGHVDVPIPREVSHADNNNLAIVLSDCYNSLLTPAGKISNMSDYVDDVKAITCKCLAEDIPVDEVKNHNPIT